MTDDLRGRIELALAPLHGWTTPEKGTRLAELVAETKADVTVEIGVFGGRGTIAMAIAHQLMRKGHVAAIDPWEAQASLDGENAAANDEWWSKVDYELVYEQFLTALLRNGVARYCRVMRERSDTAVRLFADGSVSVLHQDGNHSEAVTAAEVTLWAPKLATGGYWVADDADWGTTQRALTMLEEMGFARLEDHGGWRVYQKR